MAEVIWRARAVRQLDALADYLHERNPHAASRYVSGLRGACQNLADFPERGRRYDERYRVIVFRNHVIFYRYEAGRDRVLISAIFDGRRNIALLLGTEHGGETDTSPH